MNKTEGEKTILRLQEIYDKAECELNFSSAYELLVAVVLSAQTTDKMVNRVTPDLFSVANTPEKMVKLGVENIEQKIKKIGLYRSKARYLYDLSVDIITKFDSKVPDNFDDLISLKGVGRKTANVLLSVYYNIPQIAVDTHVKRLAQRLGFSKSDDVVKIEMDLRKYIPKELWISAHHLMIFHGRRVCKKINPKCFECQITDICNYYKG